MIYVLVIVALFAALSFVLARQNNTGETGILDEEKVGIYASVIQQASMQLKQSIEQMTFTGSQIDDLDFVTPDDANYNVGSNIHKVFHPQGGGMILPRIPDEAIDEITTPSARWYIGRFNDVEWTPSTNDDVILTAYQISQQVCERLNETLTGSTNVPVLTVPATDVLIFKSGGNTDFTSIQCQDADSPANDVDCDGQPALCVQDSNGAWSFFSLMAVQ
ncbi:MAG: hypothetical protein H6867_01910 [Rhodospirillales bacterium]|nr:hypothetical protein [Rhodospirillales bacterium]MCB9997273.1 hypothetical protein [Rhodospirillales bacterium]